MTTNDYFILIASSAVGSFAGSMIFSVLTFRPKARRTRGPNKQPMPAGTAARIFKQPFTKSPKKSPLINDDESGWRKENNMDLKD